MAEPAQWEPLTGWKWRLSVATIVYGRAAGGVAWLRLELLGREWTVMLGRDLALCRRAAPNAGESGQDHRETER